MPSRLNEYPVGITNATIRRGTPIVSIACIARGSARFRRRGRERDQRRLLDALGQNCFSGTRNISAIGRARTGRARPARRTSVRIELAEVDQHPEPAVSDGHGHRRADADRRVLHDDAGELEHHLRQRPRSRAEHLLRLARAPATARRRRGSTRRRSAALRSSTAASKKLCGHDVLEERAPRRASLLRELLPCSAARRGEFTPYARRSSRLTAARPMNSASVVTISK